MKVLLKVALFALVVAVAGALLAPPLYWLGRWAVAHELLPILRRVGFQSYFHRAVLIVAVAVTVPFLRWLGLRRWTDLGLMANPRGWMDMALGVGVGVVGLWSVGSLLIGFGHASLRQPVPWAALGSILLTAVAVSLIEETLFRGVLLGMLRRALSWPAALSSLSFLFALLHFVKPPLRASSWTTIEWYSGFVALSRSFWQFGEPRLVLAGWVSLFLVGWVLGYTVVRTRSLYLAIGLHGGWVFALRSFDRFFQRRDAGSLWLGKELTTGLFPILLLLVTLGFLHLWLRHRAAEGGDRGRLA